MLLDAGYLKVCDFYCAFEEISAHESLMVQEFNEPAVLLENPKSMFYSLVEQTGPVVASQLTEMAKQVYFPISGRYPINITKHCYLLTGF